MNINEVRGLSQFIGKIPVQSLSIGSMKKIVKLDKDLKAEQEAFSELQTKLLESYEVKSDEKTQRYEWNDHPKAAEISKKVEELFAMDLDLPEMNFMSEEEFYACCKEFKVAEISSLSEYLLAETVEGPKDKPSKKKKGLKKA